MTILQGTGGGRTDSGDWRLYKLVVRCTAVCGTDCTVSGTVITADWFSQSLSHLHLSQTLHIKQKHQDQIATLASLYQREGMRGTGGGAN